MKKIFALLAISLALVLPIVSCSSDDVSAKQAETDRNELVIPGDEDNSSVEYNQLALYASATNVNVGTLVSFTTMLNGVDVTEDVTYYINNIEVDGSSITSVFNGTFRVQAKLEGYIDSKIITVVYGGGGNNPNPGTNGNFIFNGVSHNVIANVLILNGADTEDNGTTYNTYWSSMIVNSLDDDNITVGAIIAFKTPFTLTDPETGNGDVALPNGTNETYIGAPYILVNNEEFEEVVGNGTIHYTSDFNYQAPTNAFTSNVTFNGNTLQINYNGDFSFVNNSARGTKSATSVNTNKTMNIKINKATKTKGLKKFSLN